MYDHNSSNINYNQEGETKMSEKIRSDAMMVWRNVFIAYAKSQKKIDLFFNSPRNVQRRVIVKMVGADYIILDDEYDTAINTSTIMAVRKSKKTLGEF